MARKKKLSVDLETNYNGKGVKKLNQDLEENKNKFSNSETSIKKYQKELEKLEINCKTLSDKIQKLNNNSKGTSNTTNVTSQSFAQLQNSISKVSTAINYFLGLKLVGYIFNIGKAVLSASSDMTELQNVTDQVFGNMADDVQKFAESSSDVMGRSIYALKSYASEMGSIFKGLGGFEDDSIKKMSQDLARLSVDIGSFKNISDEQAFNALRGGIVGETESLKRLGIVINDTTMAEYARAKGIKESWQNLDASTKALLRYEALMEKTKFMQGDAARTLNEYANQLKLAEANMKNLATILGDKLKPTANGVVQSFNSILSAINSWLNKKSAMNFAIDFSKEQTELKKLQYEYEYLSKQSNKTSDDRERMKNIVDELKSKYPDELKNINSLTTSYTELSKALELVTKSLRDKTQASFEEYINNKLIKIQTDSQSQFEKIGSDKQRLKETFFKTFKANMSDILTDDVINSINFDNAESKLYEIANKIKQKTGKTVSHYMLGELDSYINNLKSIKLEEDRLLKVTKEKADKIINNFSNEKQALTDLINIIGKSSDELTKHQVELSQNQKRQSEQQKIELAKTQGNLITTIYNQGNKTTDTIIGNDIGLTLKETEEILKNRGVIEQVVNGITKTYKQLDNGKIEEHTKKNITDGRGHVVARVESKKQLTNREFSEQIKASFKLDDNKPKINNFNSKEEKKGLKEKQLNKWEQLQEQLYNINKELDRTLLTPQQLENIKKLSIVINEKQNINIDNLKNVGIINNSQALSEKIKNTEHVIKNLTLLSHELNKDDPRLKEIADKLKFAKSELDKFKNEAREQSFLDKLSEDINNTKFEYSDNTKAVANKKIQENLNISLSKNEENYNNNLITINEYAKRKIDIIKKAITLQQELGNKEELAINIKKEYLAKLDELAIQNKQSIDITNIRNEITKHIENVGKYAVDLLNIEDIKSKYNSSKEQLFKAIENLPESIKGLIDIKKPLKQQFDTILKDSKLLKEDRLIIERIKELYNTTEKTYKEINKKQKQMNLPKVIEENLSFSLEQIKKLSKSFNNDALNDIVNEFTNTISSISSVGIKAATGDYAGAIKDALSYIVGFVSNIISNFTVDYNKKAKEDYEKRQDELISNTKALNELKENILSLNSSIIKLTSANTSNENIENNRKYSQALNEVYAENFNPKLLINGTSSRQAKKWQWWEYLLSALNPAYLLGRGIYSAAALKKENVSYTKNFTDLFNTKGKNSKELQELYDTKIKHLTNNDLKQFLDKKNNAFVNYDFINIHSNLEDIKKQFLKKIDDVKKLELDNNHFKENTIFESFDGISIVDLEAKKKEMLNKFKSLVKDEKELEKMLPEFEKKVDDLLKGQDKIITAFDDTRNNIIGNLASGLGVLDSLTNGLQGYFNKLRSNLAKIKYDVEFREFKGLEDNFINKFKKISEELVKIRVQNGKTLKDLDPKTLDFSALFKQLKNISNVSDDMRSIIENLRSQAKSEGMSQELIDQMLPLDKVNEKIKFISDSLKNAMHLALDTNSFTQFNMSLGQSLYNHVKENLIKAFIDSNKFQELYKQYIETPEFNKQLNNATSIKEWYDLIQKQLQLTENKLKSEGLGFKETNASNGEYLGGLVNRSGLDNVTNSLIEKGTKIEIQQNINNYGYLSIDDLVNGMVNLISDKLAEKKKKEV